MAEQEVAIATAAAQARENTTAPIVVAEAAVSAVGSKAIPVMTNTNFLPYKSATVPPIKPPRVPPMIDAVTKPECCNGLFKGGSGEKSKREVMS
jgi:hypothetical protein